MCVAAENRKNNEIHYLGGSRSFKVIDVDTTKKLVTSACYDKQHACAYLQPFYAGRAISGKIFLGRRSKRWRYPAFTFSFERTPSPSGTKFCHKKLESLRQPTVKISSSYQRFKRAAECDKQTGR